MNSKELLKNLIIEKDISQAEIAKQIGISTQALWDRINSKKTNSLSVNKLNEILKVLGYKIVILPNSIADNITDAYIVEE